MKIAYKYALETLLCVFLALCLSGIAILLGPTISNLAGFISGVSITSSDATGYFIQALLAVVIAYEFDKSKLRHSDDS